MLGWAAPRSDQGSTLLRSSSPAAESAPAAGNCAKKSIVVPVAGTQNVAAKFSASAFVEPPGGTPTSLMLRAADRPKAPGASWPGQKIPPLEGRVDVPVVRLGSTTVSAPRKWIAGGGQSIDVCADPTAVQDSPTRSPPSQTPLTQRGHGSLGCPLKYTRLDSAVARFACGGKRATLPQRSVKKAFTTQAEAAPFDTGIGGPK